MIRRLIGLIVGLIGLSSFGYVFFFVPLRTGTLYEHVRAVIQTEPAQELKADLKDASSKLVEKARGVLEPTDAGAMEPDSARSAAPDAP